MMTQVKTKKYKGNRPKEALSREDPDLGDLGLFLGTWENSDRFKGAGWNVIALPLVSSGVSECDSGEYRVQVNQYKEILRYTNAVKEVSDAETYGPMYRDANQRLVALNYEQVAGEYRSKNHQTNGLSDERITNPVKHKLGMWLQTLDDNDDATYANRRHRDRSTGEKGINQCACLCGDSALAPDQSKGTCVKDNETIIPEVNPFPLLTSCGPTALDSSPLDKYLEPYSAFVNNPNSVFPAGYDLRNLHELLAARTPKNVNYCSEFYVSTRVDSEGISNVPFFVEHAEAVETSSIYWIFELDEVDDNGEPILVMQYIQTMMLEFFDKLDGTGKIRWPHINLNTLVRTQRYDWASVEI